jgi:HSP20 family protein
MADTDVQTQINDAGDKAAGAARRGAEAGAQTVKKAADAVNETAQAGIDAEQRSFSAASDAGRQSAAAIGRAAQTSLKAGQEMARHSQDMAKRATTQAADFWRSSMTPMSQLTGEFNRWFDQMWRGAGGLNPMGMQGGLPMAMFAQFSGHPLADLRETDRGYELAIDLPGMKAEDIELTIRGDMLHVSGEKAEQQQEGQNAGAGTYRFSERRFGRFDRGFALPPGADRSKIEASFQDGVLKIEIPAAPEGEQAQTITVKTKS